MRAPASGAGITNGNGTLTVTNDTFSSDQANGSAAGVAGLGGAIYSPGGSLTVTGSTFTFDQAVGGAGAPGVSDTPFGQGGNGGDGLSRGRRGRFTWAAAWRRSAAASSSMIRPSAAQAEREEQAVQAGTAEMVATPRAERSILPAASCRSAAALSSETRPPAAPAQPAVARYLTRVETAGMAVTAPAVRS